MPSESGKNLVDLSISISIPPYFKCPISLDLMTDPVSLCTGITYERVYIERWLAEGSNVCPATKQVLQSKELIPNHTLRRLIHEWCIANSSNGLIRIPTPKPVAEPSRVRQIIQDIEDATIDKVEALKNLRILAEGCERNRQCLHLEGVLPVLIHVLDSDTSLNSQLGVDRGAIEEAIGAISMFSGLNDMSTKRALMRPSVLKTLEWVLETYSLEARMNVASIVEKLASDRNSARVIGSREGITGGLLKLSGENIYPSAIKASLKALFPLCTVPKNTAKLAKAGAVPRLIEVLPGAERSVTELSLAILEALSTTSEGRSAIVSHVLALPTIIRNLLVVSDTATNYVVDILLAVCLHSAEGKLQRDVVQMGAFDRLLLLLQMDCSPTTKQRTNKLLRLLFPVHQNSLAL